MKRPAIRAFDVRFHRIRKRVLARRNAHIDSPGKSDERQSCAIGRETPPRQKRNARPRDQIELCIAHAICGSDQRSLCLEVVSLNFPSRLTAVNRRIPFGDRFVSPRLVSPRLAASRFASQRPVWDTRAAHETRLHARIIRNT